MDDSYLNESWINEYTKGFATNVIQDGCVKCIFSPPIGETIKTSSATEKHYTNYTAKVKALEQKAKQWHLPTDNMEYVVFLADSKFVLDALNSNEESRLRHLLDDISQHRRVVSQLIPAHCGIPDNPQTILRKTVKETRKTYENNHQVQMQTNKKRRRISQT